ncbi:M67 family metallopeptidase [Bacillus sp. KH172YL63]|uniref:M67 family metallopeptidase n=1 Tax=Bacillus sp. KH172YL63 TaxID=2709784 RepID=UPI0013E44B6A|nr:M67 family metallopeptidase [Bacillus sp. KH172YL63]BCB03439.1 CysO-cysteine peptidase [Bacillus sp. KH172YL63]
MSKLVYMRIMLEVRKDLPNEACGLLSGSGNQCLTVWPMTNTEPTPFSFAIDPVEQDRVMEEMVMKKETFLGIYHSHPNGRPVPSRDDVEYSLYPDVYYFIAAVSVKGEELRCYKINHGKVRHIEILIQ